MEVESRVDGVDEGKGVRSREGSFGIHATSSLFLAPARARTLPLPHTLTHHALAHRRPSPCQQCLRPAANRRSEGGTSAHEIGPQIFRPFIAPTGGAWRWRGVVALTRSQSTTRDDDGRGLIFPEVARRPRRPWRVREPCDRNCRERRLVCWRAAAAHYL